jgi:hypothetical protein
MQTLAHLKRRTPPMSETQALVTLGCEPGSEECPLSCNNRVATTTDFDEAYRSYEACYFGGEEIINNKRTPSCLAAEAKATELRERAEKAEAEWDHWKGRYEQAVKEGNARFAEMDDRCHRTEYALSQAEARLRTTAQILISEIGADGPKNAECAAREAVQAIKNIRAELAITRARLAEAEGLVAGPVLPTIALSVDGHVTKASGSEPCDWSIYSEHEADDRGRTRVKVDGRLMADITIHPTNGNSLSDEVQTVAAGLVWSGIRAWHRRNHSLGCVSKAATPAGRKTLDESTPTLCPGFEAAEGDKLSKDLAKETAALGSPDAFANTISVEPRKRSESSNSQAILDSSNSPETLSGCQCAAGPWRTDVSNAPRDEESKQKLLLRFTPDTDEVHVGRWNGYNWTIHHDKGTGDEFDLGCEYVRSDKYLFAFAMLNGGK